MIDYDEFFFLIVICTILIHLFKINTSITQKNVRFYVILIKSKYTATN